MAIDPTPSRVATSALQAIPFGSIIGGPLSACIEAQAMAAQTTWNFIQEVGLNPADENGNRTTVQTVFQYQKDGQMVNLVVPLLAIVPIPYIAIDTININFTASISASSSSVSEEASESEAGGSAEVAAKFGWGPFSVSANFKANYSSKKSSKATQESKYSVEYTMDVVVNAGQDSMPAGLAAVLNILQESITDSPPGGSFRVNPANTQIDADALPNTQIAPVTAKLLGATGLGQEGQKIDFSLADSSDRAKNTLTNALTIKETQGGEKYTDLKVNGGKFEGSTDSKGMLQIELSLTNKKKISVNSLTFDVNPQSDASQKEQFVLNFLNAKLEPVKLIEPKR